MQVSRSAFENIKQIDAEGLEFWSARDPFPLLGYSTWQAFEEVIERAIRSSENVGESSANHFSQLTKMVGIGSNSTRALKDWKLDRYACYLIAQNGDPKIKQIASAQNYFAIQTRRQEIYDSLPDASRRLFIRGEVTNENKKLRQTAKESGVTNFARFNNEGYKGLYGSALAEVELMKDIPKGELLDRAGSAELAANLFRITQTDEKLKKDKVKSDYKATMTHRDVGSRVRQAMKDIGGELPENLKPEKHIKEIKREMKELKDIKLSEKQSKLFPGND